MAQKNNWLMPVLVVAALLIITGVVTVPTGIIQLGSTAGTGTGVNTQVSTGACGDDQLATLQVRNRNLNNYSLQYIQSPITYFEGNQIVGNFSTTAGTAGTYASASDVLTCGHTYNVYVINNASVASASVKNVKADAPVKQIEIQAPISSFLGYKVYDTDGNNMTAGTNNYSYDYNTTAGGVLALGTGDTGTRQIRYIANGSDSQFGSNELPTYICANFDLSKFGMGGITVSGAGWAEAALPTYCSNNGYEKAWTIPAVKSTMGEQIATVSFRAAVGNPSEQVKFISADSAYFIGNDGTLKSGTVDESGTDVGETNTYIEISVT